MMLRFPSGLRVRQQAEELVPVAGEKGVSRSREAAAGWLAPREAAILLEAALGRPERQRAEAQQATLERVEAHRVVVLARVVTEEWLETYRAGARWEAAPEWQETQQEAVREVAVAVAVAVETCAGMARSIPARSATTATP